MHASRPLLMGTVLLMSLILVLLVACGAPTTVAPQPAAQAPAQQAPAAAPAQQQPAAPQAPAAPKQEAPKAAAPTQAPAAPTAAPAKKRLVVGMKEIISSFDYPYDWNIPSTWIQSNVGDCLIWRDRKTAEFVPWLAESFQSLSDTAWRIKIKPNIKFHNGEPLNAEAAKYSIDRILADKKALVYNQWTYIKEVKIIDDLTIEITTVAPEPAFLSKMAGTACQVVPPKYGEQVKMDFGQKPIGTGPYKFVEFKKDERVVLQANPDYFQGKPGLDEIVFRAIPDDAARVGELLTGGIDLMVAVPTQDWKRIEGSANLALDRFLTNQIMWFQLRSGPSKTLPDWDGPTKHPKVRMAAEYAIDRKALIDLIGGMGVPTRTRVIPPVLGSNPALYNTVGEYNPAKAKQLLQEAGYKGEPLTFHSTNAWFMQKEVTEAVADMLRSVGFNIDLKLMEINTFREQVYTTYKNREIYMDVTRNTFYDPWIVMLPERADRRERAGWVGPEADAADKLIKAAEINMNKEERAKQYAQLQEMVNAANGGTYVILYQMKDTLARNKRLVYEHSADGWLWLGKARFE